MTLDREDRPTPRSAILATCVLLSLSGSATVLDAQAEPRAACDRGELSGTLTDRDSGLPLPGASLIVEWMAEDRPRREWRTSATTEPDGTFAICVPEWAAGAQLWAELGDYTSGTETLDLRASRSRTLDLAVALDARPAARIVGSVRDADTHRGIDAASVTIGDRYAAVTGSTGGFVLTGLSPGSYELRVEHIGYGTATERIEAVGGRTVEVSVDLPPEPVDLEPIVVTAVRSRKLEIQGFYERKRWGELSGLGVYFTAEDVERRRPLRISHMLADAPGVQLNCRGSGMRGCTVRMARGAGCGAAVVYLDGTRLRMERDLDRFVLPVEIGGVEIYRGPGELPAEFSGTDARCGAVVIWTK